MSGLCGWFGAVGETQAPEAALASMASGLVPGRIPAGHGHADGRVGLWSAEEHGQKRFFADERHLVAIAGYPFWNSPHLAEIARERGHAAALLEAFRRDRLELFAHLSGPFSLAVVDREAGEAVLAIDRFGVHSLYFAQGERGLAFGTTADSVRAHAAVTWTIDPQAIFNYFNYFTIPAEGTIYREQRKLLPAQFVHYRDGAVRQSFYWSLDYSPVPADRPESLTEQLHTLLARSVSRAVATADGVKLGAFLSGGLDSSTVVGFLPKVTGAPPRTFTVGFPAEGFDEMHYARIAAGHFQAEPHEHYLTGDEAADAIPRVAAFFDEPFGNSSAIPAYYCARAAKERGIDMLLAGDGGDELFAGNSRYAHQIALERYFRLFKVVPRFLVRPSLTLLGRSRTAQRARNLVALITTPLPDRMLASEHLAPEELDALFTPSFLEQADRTYPLVLAREIYERTSSPAALHRMMHMDLRITLADNDLRKVVSMCRMAGVQVRFPFLDEELAAFAAKLPPELLLKGGELRAFYKQAMRGFLPQEILEKQKHGFGMPYGLWIRDHRRVAELAIEAVRSFRRREICNGSYLDTLLERGTHDEWRRSARLWDLMMLELWLQAHGNRS